MAKREDGIKTRQRLLDAASEVFAEKGYRNAKVAEICRRAGANVASVNYYFRDKASLYTETWRHAFLQYEEPDLSHLADRPPTERLRGFIETTVRAYTQKGVEGQFNRLYLMELVNPTELLHEAWRDMIASRRRDLQEILWDMLGPEADEETVLFCELSVINQCRALLTISRNDLEFFLKQPIGPELLRRLTDHIYTFSLAGIEAVGRSPSR